MSQPNSQQFPWTGPVDASVRLGSGALSVVAEETSAAVVEVTAYDDSEASRTAAAHTTVQFVDGRLRVETPEGKVFALKRSGRVSIQLRLPLESRLNVQTGSADIRIDGRINRAEIESGSGDIYARAISGDLVVKTGSGDIRSDAVGGELRVFTGSGDIRVTLAEGRVKTGTGSGDVTIEEARSSVDTTTASGDVRLGLIRGGGDVKVNTASGDVSVGVAAGTGVWLDLNTVSGRARSNLDMNAQPSPGQAKLNLRINTVSGDIEVSRVGVMPAPAAAESEPTD